MRTCSSSTLSSNSSLPLVNNKRNADTLEELANSAAPNPIQRCRHYENSCHGIATPNLKFGRPYNKILSRTTTNNPYCTTTSCTALYGTAHKYQPTDAVSHSHSCTNAPSPPPYRQNVPPTDNLRDNAPSSLHVSTRACPSRNALCNLQPDSLCGHDPAHAHAHAFGAEPPPTTSQQLWSARWL